MFRSSPLLLTAVLALGLVQAGRTQEPAKASAPPAEPPAPAASAAVQPLLDAAAKLLSEKKPAEALAAAEKALAAAVEARDLPGTASAHRIRAQALDAAGRKREALAAWKETEAAWKAAADGPGQVEALCRQAALLPEREGEMLACRAAERARAEVRRPRAAARAAYAGGCDLYLARGRLLSAYTLLQAALAVQDEKAPGSQSAFYYLPILGSIAEDQGDLVGARSYYERALALHEKAPGSLVVATTLNQLGDVAWRQGDLAVAKTYHERALTIWQENAPSSFKVVGILNALGYVAEVQGDRAGAKTYYERALAILQKQALGSRDTRSLYLLGIVARNQSDLAGAKAYFGRALAIEQEKWPGSLDVARSLHTLGYVAHVQGDLAGAKAYYERALAIFQEQAPDSLDVATSLNVLGMVVWKQGDQTGAKAYYERALAIRQVKAPGSLQVADTVNNLGVVARKQGDPAGARASFERALAIKQKQSPGSLAVAQNLHKLALVEADQMELALAGRHCQEAWRIVQAQARSVRGDEAVQAFGTSYRYYALDLLGIQLRGGDAATAFRTLEEAGAFSLRQLLAEREGLARLAGSREWSAYQQAAAAQHRAGAGLARAAEAHGGIERSLKEAVEEKDAGRAAELTRDLEQAAAELERRRSEEAAARLKAESLYAALCRSIPGLEAPAEDVGAALKALPPGTLYLAFSVGEKECHLFAASGGEVRAHRLELTQEQLTARVANLRKRLVGDEQNRAAAPAYPVEETEGAARRLYQALFPEAVRRQLAAAQRVVIAPDDVLWELPFAALVLDREGLTTETRRRGEALERGSKARYLGLEKALVLTPSLLVYDRAVQGESAASRGEGAPSVSAVVVGNPVLDPKVRAELARKAPAQAAPNKSGAGKVALNRLPAGAKPAGAKPAGAKSAGAKPVRRSAVGEVRTLFEDGNYPQDLPAAAEEAKRVGGLYRASAALGLAPTEAWLRPRLGGADVVHLATHGRYNQYRAMSSGIALAVPERLDAAKTEDDGALQAWEIMTQLKLNADLVVLSACETGRGAKVPGEGLVGLTRSFLFAGARSVVASGWKVADPSTAALMVAFHRELRQGVAKDEALRRAMRAVASDPQHPEWRAPFHWAAFMLLGDPENHRLAAGKAGR